MSQPALINLYHNEYSQELRYYPFAVNLDMCAGSSNTPDDLSNRVCVPNETEDLNVHIFDMITGISESRTLAKHIPCKCECKFAGRKCNLNQESNNAKCQCECKNKKEHWVCEKKLIWYPAICSCESGKYTGSIGESVVVSDKIAEETKIMLTKTTLTKSSDKKYFNKFLHFTKFLISYHSIIDSY